MEENNLYILPILIWVFIFVWIIFTDIKYRVISNKVVLISLINVFLSSYVFDLEISFLNFILFLLVGFTLFSLGIVGGGDVKLLSSLSLILPKGEVLFFIFVMSIFGAILGLFCLLFKSKSVPYGVAIVGAFFLCFCQNFNIVTIKLL